MQSFCTVAYTLLSSDVAHAMEWHSEFCVTIRHVAAPQSGTSLDLIMNHLS